MKLSLPIRRLRPPFIRSIPYRLLVFSLCALCVLCGQLKAQDFKSLKDGIEYAEVTKDISGLKVNMNLLRLDLRKVRLDVRHAMDAAIGTEKTSSIATRHGAFAAINAGFFRLDTSIFAGDPAGVLMIDGELWSASFNNRVAMGIVNGPTQTEVAFVHLGLENILKIGNKSFLEEVGVNQELKDDALVIYTPRFHRTTLTGPNCVEIVVQKGIVRKIVSKAGSSIIPSNGFVIAASGKMRDEILKYSKIGVKSSATRWRVMDDARPASVFEQAEDIVGGVPRLIIAGKINITWEWEKSSKSFVETRHPRTAVAKLRDGKFLMITVDGRTESSGGIGLQDLAEYLLSLGATDAMNLDGGGSTTMFVDGKVVNHPSDREGERKVSDAILVTPRIKKK